MNGRTDGALCWWRDVVSLSCLNVSAAPAATTSYSPSEILRRRVSLSPLWDRRTAPPLRPDLLHAAQWRNKAGSAVCRHPNFGLYITMGGSTDISCRGLVARGYPPPAGWKISLSMPKMDEDIPTSLAEKYVLLIYFIFIYHNTDTDRARNDRLTDKHDKKRKKRQRFYFLRSMLLLSKN